MVVNVLVGESRGANSAKIGVDLGRSERKLIVWQEPLFQTTASPQ